MNESKRKNILSLFKSPTCLLVMLGFSLMFFYFQYLTMKNLPGYRDEMCVMGAGLNLSNIIFSITTSIMASIFIVGFYCVLKENRPDFKGLSFSGIGLLLGGMTVFCASCAFQVISIFGVAVGLHLFSEWNIWFKILSLALMSYGLYSINKQLKGTCSMCVE